MKSVSECLYPGDLGSIFKSYFRTKVEGLPERYTMLTGYQAIELCPGSSRRLEFREAEVSTVIETSKSIEPLSSLRTPRVMVWRVAIISGFTLPIAPLKMINWRQHQFSHSLFVRDDTDCHSELCEESFPGHIFIPLEMSVSSPKRARRQVISAYPLSASFVFPRKVYSGLRKADPMMECYCSGI